MRRMGIILCFMLIIVLLTGCRNKISRGEFLELKKDLEMQGKDICNSKSMDYLVVDIKDFEEANVICLMRSPKRPYLFGLEVGK